MTPKKTSSRMWIAARHGSNVLFPKHLHIIYEFMTYVHTYTWGMGIHVWFYADSNDRSAVYQKTEKGGSKISLCTSR